jgi:hypothetical protein
VIGLSLKLINDEALSLLRGQDYFGQYGKIQKIMINKRKDIPPLRGGTFDKPGSSVSVYVTFTRKEDASKCIAALDGAMVDGQTLRAAYGTTKYCTTFLQHRQCQNPNCMYLHSEQDQDDTEFHTREETSTIQHAAKMGQNPISSRGTPGTTTTKPPPTEEKHDRPILPTSVSWAKAAASGRAHSPPQERTQQPLDQRRQSVMSSAPSQPSPVSTPTPPPVAVPVAAPEKPTAELIKPSGISLDLATSDQHSKVAMNTFDKILENFKKGSFKFGFASELLETEEYTLAAQAKPYFDFKQGSELLENGDSETKTPDSKTTTAYSPKPRGFDPFASLQENGTHKRDQSRFAYVNDPLAKVMARFTASAPPPNQLVRSFSPPRTSDAVITQQYLPQSASQYKTATPPPPGMYFSHVQQHDHQRRQLLEQQQQRLQSYPSNAANPDYGYYPQQQQQPIPNRQYASNYDDDHAGVYAPQARRHLLDNQGYLPKRRDLPVDSLQELSGSLMNMRMSPHLQQGYTAGGQQPPPPQNYGGQSQFVGGRRYMGSAF